MKALKHEVELREENKKKRLPCLAAFPSVKSFAYYDYSHVTIPSVMKKVELENATFVPGKQNLVIYGFVGTGKTHMVNAAGREMCKRGHKALFYTVANLFWYYSVQEKMEHSCYSV